MASLRYSSRSGVLYAPFFKPVETDDCLSRVPILKRHELLYTYVSLLRILGDYRYRRRNLSALRHRHVRSAVEGINYHVWDAMGGEEFFPLFWCDKPTGDSQHIKINVKPKTWSPVDAAEAVLAGYRNVIDTKAPRGTKGYNEPSY